MKTVKIDTIDKEHKTFSLCIVKEDGSKWRRAFAPGEIDALTALLNSHNIDATNILKDVKNMWNSEVVSKYTAHIQKQTQELEGFKAEAVVKNAEKAAHQENDLRDFIGALIKKAMGQ